MNRRSFLYFAAATPLLATPADLPKYTIVTRADQSSNAGLPGAYPGTAIRVHSDDAIDAAANRVNAGPVKAMLSAGMRELTQTKDDRDAWLRFISPDDVVGIKVNCSGAPEINSNPELVSAIIENLIAVGVPAHNVYIYDRFENQLKIVNFKPQVPVGVNIAGAETSRGSILGYDPFTYVEVDFFGEDDTRSNLIRLVSEKFTKVINVPTMKEHRAAGSHRLFEKHVVRRLFERGALTPFRKNKHVFVHRNAGFGAAAALESCVERDGRLEKPMARRPLPAGPQVPVLSQANRSGHRSCGAGSSADRHD